MPVTNQNIAPMTIQQKLNPLGAHLLHAYYSLDERSNSAEKKISHRFYNINDPKDIPIIMSCESETEIYGMIVVTGGRHRTPIIVKGEDVVVLESLGTSKSKVGTNSVTQIGMAINSVSGKNYNIYAPSDNRQIDSISCGTDSFLALKEGLRLGNRLFDQIRSQPQNQITLSNNSIIDKKEKADSFYMSESLKINQFKSLPPEIAKYSQSVSAIERLDNKENIIAVNSIKQENSTETVLDYAKRHTAAAIIRDSKADKEIPVDLLNSKETIKLKGTKETITNDAVDKRRKKHKTIVTNLLNTLNDSQLEDIVLESSGITLILNNIDKLPSNLQNVGGDIDNVSLNQMLEEYIADEIHKQLDERSLTIPDGRYNLQQLAKKAYLETENARSLNNNTTKKIQNLNALKEQLSANIRQESFSSSNPVLSTRTEPSVPSSRRR